MLVDVGGHRLYLESQGTGSPTVVLDAGLNHGADAWALIQPEIVVEAIRLLIDAARERESA
jgi:hypothetical protein